MTIEEIARKKCNEIHPVIEEAFPNFTDEDIWIDGYKICYDEKKEQFMHLHNILTYHDMDEDEKIKEVTEFIKENL